MKTGTPPYSCFVEIVSPTGDTRLEPKEFTRVECREASKFVEQGLGAKAGEQMTAEFRVGQAERQILRLQA